MAIIIKDFFMFKASGQPKVINLQLFRRSKLLVKLNKNEADELNQCTTSFPLSGQVCP